MTPDWKRYIAENLPTLGLSPARELEIIEEMAQHLEAVYEDAIESGASETEASARAVALIKDWRDLECELARHAGDDAAVRFESEFLGQPRRKGDWFMRSILQDLRFGWRLLLKSPGFLAAAVLSLALGIGANTAIFSVIDAVLLKMLPVERPEELRFIANAGERGVGGSPPYPCFERFRDQTKSFVGMSAFSRFDPRLTIDGQTEDSIGQRVSGNYFALLGVQAALGRVFGPEDDSIPGQGGRDGLTAVISYNYWTRRFGQNPSVIGKSIKVNERLATIIGVTAPGFYGLFPGAEIAISLPIYMTEAEMLTDKQSWWFQAVGRLKPGVTAAQARAELDAIFQVYMGETTISAEGRRNNFARIELPSASRGLDSLRRQYSLPLQALMAIVILTLLIACANVANLLLSRATARRKEFAMRMALGASRFRLVRQMLIESLLLVGLGGALGLGIARLGTGYLTSFFAAGRNRMFLDAPLDARVLAFTIGVSLLTGLFFGLAPAIRAARVDLNPVLKDGGGAGRLKLGKALVVGQIVLSLLLLVGAGLFLRTLHNLKSIDAGFQPAGVVLLQLHPAGSLYPAPRRMLLWKDILVRVERLPGVESASLSTLTPLEGSERGIGIGVTGFTPSSERDRGIGLNQVSAGFLSTMKIPLLEGRDFRPEDDEKGAKVAIINETAAKLYFAGRSALGGQIKTLQREEPYQVIGVVKDSRYGNLREPDSRRLYLPMPQAIDGLGNMSLAVRTTSGSEALNAIRNEINAAGPEIFINNIRTLETQVDQSLLQERLVSTLSIAFGALGLVLAAIGLFGVLSYDVARRTHEIGVRMALGARAADVIRLVMRETFAVVAVGVTLGLAASLAAAKLISTLLFGLSARDPLTFTIAGLLMVVTALVAGYLPARRASRVDPMVALRIE